MALRHRRRWLSAFTLTALVAGFGWAVAQPDKAAVKSPPPATLAPQASLLFFTCEGSLPHAAEWKQTAAYKSLYESGLAELVTKALDFGHGLAGKQGAGPFVSLGREVLNHVMGHGATLAATVQPPQNGPPTGYAILVLHDAAQFAEPVGQLAVGFSQGELEFQTAERSGRNVTFAVIPDSPGVEIGWWQERGHLVIVAGIDAVNAAIAVAAGETPNATTHPLYAKYIAPPRDFIVTTGGWFDAAAVRGLISGIPLPPDMQPPEGGPLTVGRIIDMAGFGNLNAVAGVAGFKGAASWSENWVDAPAPRTGLLSLAEGEPLTLADLPPMPATLNTFTATRFSAARLYDQLLTAAREVAKLAPPDENAPAQVEDFLQMARSRLGLDIRNDLLAHLGDVLCIYDDSKNGVFNLGAGVVVKLKNPVGFKVGMDKLLRAAERESQGAVLTRTVEKYGREMVLIELHPTPFGYSYAIDGEWLVLGAPQLIQSYLLRANGTLPRWTPSPEHEAAFGAMPRSFSGITVADPRGFINLIGGLLPLAIGFAETGVRQSGQFPPGVEFPIHMEDIPPAELISRPLFPNVGMVEVTADGFHGISRTSLPGLPLGGGSNDAATTTATVAVLVALLLPAVQQARMAARKSQSQDHLHNLAIAMHSYEAAFKSLPAGTIPNAELAPEERLSWMAELLPFLEQKPLYDQFDRSTGWAQGANLQVAAAVVDLFLNPGNNEGGLTYSVNGDPLGGAHYVGIAGLGEDGPTLPVSDPRAGVFAYDRKTRIRDIRDGTSNTMMISEATGDFGGWAQGGRATIRALTQQPYVNGPDGIGGPFPGGVQVGMGDGKVVFLSENIDPTVMEALATINGGEAVRVP